MAYIEISFGQEAHYRLFEMRFADEKILRHERAGFFMSCRGIGESVVAVEGNANVWKDIL